MLRIRLLAGLNLRARGGLRSEEGRSVIAAWIADWTLRRAPSTSRLMSNCRLTLVLPGLEREDISVT